MPKHRLLVMVQFHLSLIAVMSGAITFGLALLNNSFPMLAGLPLFAGLMCLITSYLAPNITQASHVDYDFAPCYVKRKVVRLHYTLSAVCCILCATACVLSSLALTRCVADDKVIHGQCMPGTALEVSVAFFAVDFVLNLTLFIAMTVGCLLFCSPHAQEVGDAEGTGGT